ncbi:MAG: flavodoxin family protein [Dehalococcoidia bacterium]|nr:MAG: flavodoxin family protein [Dehalococcoidia bacterium]
MKVLLVFDSVQGNTEKIARAIAAALAPAEVKVVRPGEVGPQDLKSIDLLVVGSPTMGGRPTRPMQAFLSGIPAGSLNGINVTAFDTRIPATWVKIFGFAAGKIARSLTGKGGKLLAPPAGFFVLGSNGPLKEGELERAGVWIKGIQSGKK